jgi:drug/metabolite transporter (DMT)-like permease
MCRVSSRTLAAALLALGSAFLYAVASVAQQHAASGVADHDARGARLLLRLVRKPRWWAGFVGDVGGYALQAAALGLGSLLLVQPLLVASLLFALALGAVFAGRPATPGQLAWAALLTAALAGFVVLVAPSSGREHGSARAWILVALLGGPVLAGCLLAARRVSGTRRAVLLAVVVGLLFGVTAVLTKGAVADLGHGVGPLLRSPATWALAAVATTGTVVQQSAFQAGALRASLPAVMVLEPVIASLLGLTVLHEHLAMSTGVVALLGIDVVALLAGTIALARSNPTRGPWGSTDRRNSAAGR